MRWAVLLGVLAGCGRLGFDPVGGDGGPGVDAPVAEARLLVFDGAGDDEVNDVAFDASGVLAVAGNYATTVSLGALAASSVATGGTDAFAAVVERDGTPRRLWTAGATVQGDGEGVAWFADGRLELAGYFAGTLTRTTPLDAGAGQDTFALTFDPSGNVVVANHYGASRNVQPRGLDVSATRIAAAGIYADTVDFGAGPLPATTADNAWIVTIPSTGAAVDRPLNGGDDVYINDIALGPDDAVCVTGRFKATTDFGAGPVAPSGQTTFVAMYDSALGLRWVRVFGTSTVGNGVAFASNGDCVAEGEFAATFAIDGFTAVNAGASDGWLARFGAQGGAVHWLHRFGGAGADLAFAVGVGEGDEVIVAGNFAGAAMLDDLAVTSEGAGDGFVLGYDLATGVRRWATLLAGTGPFAPGRGGLSIDRANGRVAVGAQFTGELRLDGAVAAATDLAGVVAILPIPPR